MRNTIVILLLALIATSCQRSKKETRQSNPPQIINTISPIDTAKILKLLEFNDDDSLYIHVSKFSEGYDSEVQEYYFRMQLTNNPQDPRIIDIRYALSIFPGKNYRDYGSFVVLYKELNDTSSVKRIQEDSIELSLDNLSLYSPQFGPADINFDGYRDLIISFSSTTAGTREFNRFLVYNPTKREFAEDTALTSMFYNDAIYINGEKQEISCGGNSFHGWGYNRYKWNGRTYELYAREGASDNSEGTARIYKREELVNGVWKIVKEDTSFYKSRRDR